MQLDVERHPSTPNYWCFTCTWLTLRVLCVFFLTLHTQVCDLVPRCEFCHTPHGAHQCCGWTDTVQTLMEDLQLLLWSCGWCTAESGSLFNTRTGELSAENFQSYIVCRWGRMYLNLTTVSLMFWCQDVLYLRGERCSQLNYCLHKCVMMYWFMLCLPHALY